MENTQKQSFSSDELDDFAIGAFRQGFALGINHVVLILQEQLNFAKEQGGIIGQVADKLLSETIEQCTDLISFSNAITEDQGSSSINGDGVLQHNLCCQFPGCTNRLGAIRHLDNALIPLFLCDRHTPKVIAAVERDKRK